MHVKRWWKKNRFISFNCVGNNITRLKIRIYQKIVRTNVYQIIGNIHLLWMWPDRIGRWSFALWIHWILSPFLLKSFDLPLMDISLRYKWFHSGDGKNWWQREIRIEEPSFYTLVKCARRYNRLTHQITRLIVRFILFFFV